MKLISKLVAVAAIATLVVPVFVQAAPAKTMAKNPMKGGAMKKTTM